MKPTVIDKKPMTDYCEVDEIGQLRPYGFENIMAHDDTSIQIVHDGRMIADIDASKTTVVRPRMDEQGENCRIRFGVDTVVPIGTVDNGDETSDDEDTKDEAADRDSEDTEDKMTFTLSDGPPE